MQTLLVKNLRKLTNTIFVHRITKTFNLRTVKMIPIVIGCLGAYMPNLSKFLKELPGKYPLASLLKYAMLGSAQLLRRVLVLPEISTKKNLFNS